MLGEGRNISKRIIKIISKLTDMHGLLRISHSQHGRRLDKSKVIRLIYILNSNFLPPFREIAGTDKLGI